MKISWKSRRGGRHGATSRTIVKKGGCLDWGGLCQSNEFRRSGKRKKTGE